MTATTDNNLLARLARAATVVAGAALLGMAAAEAWQVFARYVLNDSPGWTEPVALLLLNTAMSLGAAAGVRSWSHFGFFILVHNVSPALQRVLQAFACIVVAAVGAALAIWGDTQVRFHASQLEMLLPGQADRYRAITAKADLLEQLLGRPTLLTTPQGIREAMDKTSEVERLYGDEVDPDVLAIKGLISWRVGASRRDEHEAASLCARAVRVGRGEFPLQPLAVDILRAFMHAPYLAPGTPLARDAESLPDLEAALAVAGEPRRGFPLERALAFAELVRVLDRASSRAYVRMIEAHADVVRLARAPGQARTDAGAPRTLDEARATRTKWARELLAAWKAFDAAVQAVPGLEGSPEVLAIFRINDAVWPRALWFVDQPGSNDLAPAFAELSARPDSTSLKILLAPPRVAWARRYAALLAGPARTLVELQEAARYRTYEKAALSFERALVALWTGGGGGGATDAGRVADARRRAVLGAAHLGLFVDGGSGGRLPYALEILRRWPAPRAEFEEALSARAPYLMPASATAAPPATASAGSGSSL